MEITKKGISFSSALAIMITLVVFNNLLDFMSARSLLMTLAYVFMALALETHKGLLEFIERIWYISKNGEEDNEKFLLIKSFIELSVNKWDEYWQLYQEIANGAKRSRGIVRYLKKIPGGTINLKQLIWILMYMTFNVFMFHELIPIPEPVVTFLLDVYGLSFFVYTGSRIVGMRAFMTNLFKVVNPKEEENVRQILQSLESAIMLGARNYGYLKKRCITKKEKEDK